MSTDEEKLAHIQVGDMLKHRGLYGIEIIGPVIELHPTSDGRRIVLIRSEKVPGVPIAVSPLRRVLAVIRDGKEVICFDEEDKARGV